MRHILSAANLPRLAEFAQSNVLLAFDYDGTLAPIVSDPAAVRVRSPTRRLLSDVLRCFPCVVISGRRYDDIAMRVRPLPFIQVFGNHGIEPVFTRADSIALVRRWVRLVQVRLEERAGVIVEDKVHSLTVHYRHARDRPRAKAAVMNAVCDLRDARVIGGTKAVSVIPSTGADKGIALQYSRTICGCDRAIYVGDDDTDEDAFGSAPGEQLLTIRVGARRASRSRYALHNQREIDALLRALLVFRGGGRSGKRSLIH